MIFKSHTLFNVSEIDLFGIILVSRNTYSQEFIWLGELVRSHSPFPRIFDNQVTINKFDLMAHIHEQVTGLKKKSVTRRSLNDIFVSIV